MKYKLFATDFGPSPSSPTLLALSTNSCHQASSCPKLHFFPPLQKHMFSFLSTTLIKHLLFTKPYSRYITVWVCLLFVCLQALLPPLIPKTGIYSSFKIQSNCLFLHEKILWNFLQFPHVNFYDTLLKLLIYQMLLLDSGPLQHKESDLYFCNQSSD